MSNQLLYRHGSRVGTNDSLNQNDLVTRFSIHRRERTPSPIIRMDRPFFDIEFTSTRACRFRFWASFISYYPLESLVFSLQDRPLWTKLIQQITFYLKSS